MLLRTDFSSHSFAMYKNAGQYMVYKPPGLDIVEERILRIVVQPLKTAIYEIKRIVFIPSYRG